MDENRLFLATLRDLEERLTRPDEYGMLRTAALLRQLLLDKNRLVDQVNRPLRLKFSFEIADNEAYQRVIFADRPSFYSVQDALDPTDPIFGRTRILTRDQFTGTLVMVVDGNPITIKDLINHLANVEGGVHKGTPKTDVQRAIAVAIPFLTVGNIPGTHRLVSTIAKIVLAALEPLRSEVERSTPPPATWAMGPVSE